MSAESKLVGRRRVVGAIGRRVRPVVAVLTIVFGAAVASAGTVTAAAIPPAGAAAPDDGDGVIDERASFPAEQSDSAGTTTDSLNIWSAVFVVGTATLAIGGWWTNRRPDSSDSEAPLTADQS